MTTERFRELAKKLWNDPKAIEAFRNVLAQRQRAEQRRKLCACGCGVAISQESTYTAMCYRRIRYGKPLAALAAMVLVVVMLAGCKTPTKTTAKSAASINPRVVKKVDRYVSPRFRDSAARMALAAPAIPVNYMLAWDYNHPTNGVSFEVWRSLNLSAWTLKTNTTHKQLPVNNENLAQEFFRVRAKSNGLFSAWATTQ